MDPVPASCRISPCARDETWMGWPIKAPSASPGAGPRGLAAVSAPGTGARGAGTPQKVESGLPAPPARRFMSLDSRTSTARVADPKALRPPSRPGPRPAEIIRPRRTGAGRLQLTKSSSPAVPSRRAGGPSRASAASGCVRPDSGGAAPAARAETLSSTSPARRDAKENTRTGGAGE